MKICDNPIVQDFKHNSRSLRAAWENVEHLKINPKNLVASQAINQAIRWAVTRPNTFDLIDVLLPYSDQHKDCRTLFKDACLFNRLDVLRLLGERIDGGVLGHNDCHGLVSAARNNAPEIVAFLCPLVERFGIERSLHKYFRRALGRDLDLIKGLDGLSKRIAGEHSTMVFENVLETSQLDHLTFLVERMRSVRFGENASGHLARYVRNAIASANDQGGYLLMDFHAHVLPTPMDLTLVVHTAAHYGRKDFLKTLLERDPCLQDQLREWRTTYSVRAQELVEEVLNTVQRDKIFNTIEPPSVSRSVRKM